MKKAAENHQLPFSILKIHALIEGALYVGRLLRQDITDAQAAVSAAKAPGIAVQ